MRYYLTVLLLLCTGFATAQDTPTSRWSVAIAAPVKFNLGKATSTQIVSPMPGAITLDVPDRLQLRQPHFGLETVVYYDLQPRFRLGVGAGLSGSFGERDPMFGPYTRLLVPVFAAAAFDIPVSGSIDLSVSGRGGHQWHEQQFGDGSSSVVISQRGGAFLGGSVAVALRNHPWHPHLSLGYEYHRLSYDYFFPQPPTVAIPPPTDPQGFLILGPIATTPYIHVLTVSLGLHF